jgi:hypothetical protein
MSSITPTQFYQVPANQAMTLRSGKKINYSGSTTFYKECDKLIALYRKFEMFGIRDFDFQDIDGYLEFIQNYGGILSNGQKFHSIPCLRLIMFNNFLKKWRPVLNEFHIVSLKDILIHKAKIGLQALLRRKQNEELICGCTDRQRERQDRETWEETWSHYYMFGPGHWELQPDLNTYWISTPDISPEEFERRMAENHHEWKHDLEPLIADYEDHIQYLERIPHKVYQNLYFKLSSIISQDCAKNILSFL